MEVVEPGHITRKLLLARGRVICNHFCEHAMFLEDCLKLQIALKHEGEQAAPRERVGTTRGLSAAVMWIVDWPERRRRRRRHQVWRCLFLCLRHRHRLPHQVDPEQND